MKATKFFTGCLVLVAAFLAGCASTDGHAQKNAAENSGYFLSFGQKGDLIWRGVIPLEAVKWAKWAEGPKKGLAVKTVPQVLQPVLKVFDPVACSKLVGGGGACVTHRPALA